MKYKTDEERYQAHLRDMRKWRVKNKDHIKRYDATRLKNPRRREAMRACSRKHRASLKVQVEKQLGVQCIGCNAPVKHYHDVRGLPHIGGYKYILDNIDYVVPTCWQCHRGIHWLMSVGNKEWSEIYPILKSIL